MHAGMVVETPDQKRCFDEQLTSDSQVRLTPCLLGIFCIQCQQLLAVTA
jgi:hypothetical protein